MRRLVERAVETFGTVISKVCNNSRSRIGSSSSSSRSGARVMNGELGLMLMVGGALSSPVAPLAEARLQMCSSKESREVLIAGLGWGQVLWLLLARLRLQVGTRGGVSKMGGITTGLVGLELGPGIVGVVVVVMVVVSGIVGGSSNRVRGVCSRVWGELAGRREEGYLINLRRVLCKDRW